MTSFRSDWKWFAISFNLFRLREFLLLAVISDAPTGNRGGQADQECDHDQDCPPGRSGVEDVVQGEQECAKAGDENATDCEKQEIRGEKLHCRVE